MAQANEVVSKSNTTKQLDSKNDDRITNICKITVKTMEVSDLLNTFKENEAALRSIFNERRIKLDRFNYGMGYDFLRILSRLATSDQQKEMFSFMCQALAGENYYERPIYENLFWSIILPEWLIAICVKKFSSSKEDIINQVKKDDEDSFNAKQINNSFDLSLDL